MSVDVYFDDGPAAGLIEHKTYLSIALPSLAWTGDADHVQAVYHRQCDDADPDGLVALPADAALIPRPPLSAPRGRRWRGFGPGVRLSPGVRRKCVAEARRAGTSWRSM